MTAMLSLPATLNHSQATSNKASDRTGAGTWLKQASAADWQVDATALQNFDSSALALLLDLRRGAVAANTELIIHNAPVRLTQLAKLYGVDELIA